MIAIFIGHQPYRVRFLPPVPRRLARHLSPCPLQYCTSIKIPLMPSGTLMCNHQSLWTRMNFPLMGCNNCRSHFVMFTPGRLARYQSPLPFTVCCPLQSVKPPADINSLPCLRWFEDADIVCSRAKNHVCATLDTEDTADCSFPV